MFGGRVRWIQTKCHDLNFSNQEERKTFSGFTPRERKKRKREREKEKKKELSIVLWWPHSPGSCWRERKSKPPGPSAPTTRQSETSTPSQTLWKPRQNFPRGKEEEDERDDGDGWLVAYHEKKLPPDERTKKSPGKKTKDDAAKCRRENQTFLLWRNEPIYNNWSIFFSFRFPMGTSIEVCPEKSMTGHTSTSVVSMAWGREGGKSKWSWHEENGEDENKMDDEWRPPSW